jgi:uncharacterized damage-inducible protein DinB
MQQRSLDEIFADYSARKIEQSALRIATCLESLTEEQIWARTADSSNAIGNLVLHLEGNVRQWLGAGVAGMDDVRLRDAEFAARGGVARDELLRRLTATVEVAGRALTSLTAERLAEVITVQGYRMTVLEAVYHVVEHFSGHTGQIIFATKLITGGDLGFYQHLGQAGPHSERTP